VFFTLTSETQGFGVELARGRAVALDPLAKNPLQCDGRREAKLLSHIIAPPANGVDPVLDTRQRGCTPPSGLLDSRPPRRYYIIV
jgi:hypothetical protein